MNQSLWSPTQSMKDDCALTRFAHQVGLPNQDYDALHRWSISDLAGFWSQVWDFAGVIGEKGNDTFIPNAEHWMTESQFFPSARLNLAENLLKQTGSAPCVIETNESGDRQVYSADEVRAEVARVAQGLRQAGVEPGDRVAVVMPNKFSCLVTHLATLAVGGVWTSCSPDFGVEAIIDRIGQVTPKLLFVEPIFQYAGKQHDISQSALLLAQRIESVEQLVIVGPHSLEPLDKVTHWSDFGDEADLEFTRVGFDDPAYILYTSGTTGVPKAIVHRTGGVLLQQLKEHLLHNDVRKGDRVLWYTNTAWMMYHWIVAALGCDAVLVLYDGAPILKQHAGLDCAPLWRVVEQEQLTHLGISPKYLGTLAEAEFEPQQHHDLSSLRWLLSAGSPVAPNQYDWIYSAISKQVGFSSISGGTELMGCFLLGTPWHSLRKGTLTAKALGMAVNVLDDRGAPVIGRQGNLVCTEPFPSMPLSFWGEEGFARYKKTYFSDRDEIWVHGDHAQMNSDGTAVIYGRSDNTLNPGGVRIGTADIYNACDGIKEIEDCVVFGRPIAGDEEIVLCIQLREDVTAHDGLAQRIRKSIRMACSPRHVPAAIYLVDDVPYTLNGKRVEGAAQSSLLGKPVNNVASLQNPQCLEQYRNLAQERAL